MDTICYRYNVRDLPEEKAYLATVKLSVCTESSSCEANHTIFNNVLLPKQPCDWNEGFVNSSNCLYNVHLCIVIKNV